MGQINPKELKIYFAGSIRGGRKEQPLYQQVVFLLKTFGHVHSEHVADETLSSFGETHLPKEEIHARELGRIQESDLVVAETTTPSLGVGYIVAKALELGKKVVCIYNGVYTDKLSAMIKGNEKIHVIQYTTVEELKEKLKEFI